MIKKKNTKRPATNTQAKRSLGQNFLLDKNLADWVVRTVDWRDGEWLLEIGPGRGALTDLLLARPGGRLLLLEKDRELAARWREQLAGQPEREVWEGDALDFDHRQLWQGLPVVLVGNLPYNVATALLTKFLRSDSPVARALVMVQKEVAERLTAHARSKAYGSLSVFLQREWQIELLKIVPPEVFSPRPKIESALVEFRRRPMREIERCGERDFEQALRLGFSQRRKQLHKLLPIPKERWLEVAGTLGIPPTARAEELDPITWQKLAAYLGREKDHSPPGGEELFDEVSESDVVLQARPRREIHRLGLRHRAAHIILQNEEGEIFLQKRAPWKDINPGVWDSSAAGHVDAGESYFDCAHRELMEELGVRAELKKIGKLTPCPETGNEFIEVYHGVHKGPFRCNELEISAGAFFAQEQIEAWVRRAPHEFSPVFLLCRPLL